MRQLKNKHCHLMLGDCLEKMKKVKSHSVDMILCDLPYGTTQCAWDVVIPFDKLWKQYKRIIKKNGVIVLFGSEPFSTYLRLSNIKQYKYDWIWIKNKPTGFVHAKNKPMKRHETLSVFSKGTTVHINQSNHRMIYNPQNIRKSDIVKTTKRNKKDTHLEVRGKNKKQDSYFQEFTNYPDSILQFNLDSDTIHPTQKPVALLSYLIRTYTNKGMIVLDSCMGGGSTGVACRDEGRFFIGIEKEPKYFNIAKQRITETRLI